MEIISISIILVVSLEISHHILVSLAGSGRVLNGTGWGLTLARLPSPMGGSPRFGLLCLYTACSD